MPFVPDGDANSAARRRVTKTTFLQVKRAYKMKQRGFPWQYSKGGQWWSLTRETAQKCLEVIGRESELMRWFTYSLVPDVNGWIRFISENRPATLRANSLRGRTLVSQLVEYVLQFPFDQIGRREPDDSSAPNILSFGSRDRPELPGPLINVAKKIRMDRLEMFESKFPLRGLSCNRIERTETELDSARSSDS